MAAVSKTVPIDFLRRVLSYDADTGVLRWIIAPARNIKAGTEAGCVKSTGGKNTYRYVRVDGIEIPAVRIVWAMHYGEWSPNRLTFKDGDALNLRIENIVEQNCIVTKYDSSDAEQRKAYLREHRETFPKAWKDTHLRSSFGIGLAEYSAMVAAQDNKCAICGNPETEMRKGVVKALAVDHDHVTGAIRGLLCVRCNTGIGKLRDDPETLRAAADYIERHAQRTDNVIFIRAKGA